jgi:RNA polymerase sigma-70 factor, ECF subfamily
VSNPHAGDADERRHRFEAIYAAGFGPILGYVLRRTDNGEDAADVVAETFLTAWRRLDDVPPGDRAMLWLYGVARRVLANHRRGERRRSDLSDRLRAELAGVQGSGRPAHHRTARVRGAAAGRRARRLGRDLPDRAANG